MGGRPSSVTAPTPVFLGEPVRWQEGSKQECVWGSHWRRSPSGWTNSWEAVRLGRGWVSAKVARRMMSLHWGS